MAATSVTGMTVSPDRFGTDIITEWSLQPDANIPYNPHIYREI